MKLTKLQKNRGMTYIEIIVVLGIFSVLAGVVLFKYTDFQSAIDIKNLASDIALQIVQAKNSSLAGSLPPSGYSQITNWKPSYGVYFYSYTQFKYFVDLNNINGYEAGEELNTITITKNNTISRIDSYTGTTLTQQILSPLSITFSRPSSSALFTSTGLVPGFDYIQITVVAPNGTTKAYIKIYPSGRIQIN